MKVVLFCGGLGMRMRDGIHSGPKPMAMIGDRPLLWHVMRYYAHFGHTDFVLCLGYGASYVKDFFLNYDETRSNDFVLEGGDREVKLFRTDISDWRITFVDTGLNSAIGERLRRVLAFEAARTAALFRQGDALAASLHGWQRLAIAGYAGGGRAALEALALAGYEVLAQTPRPTRRRRMGAIVRVLVRAAGG